MKKKQIILKLRKKILKDSILKKVVSNIISYFPNTYLVGGFIRDIVLDIDSRNLDIIAQFSQKKISEFVSSIKGAKFFPLDSKRRIFRMIIKHDSQIKNDSKITTVDFSFYDNIKIEDELSNRDFTINAIAVSTAIFSEDYESLFKLPLDVIKDYELKMKNKFFEKNELPDNLTFELIDPFNGLKDLVEKELKLVSENALKNDPVRILRAFRFKLSHNLSISEKLKQAIISDSNMLRFVAGERKADEILKIFSNDNVSSILKKMQNLNVLKQLFPSIENSIGLFQYGYHSEDVFNHSLKCVEKMENIEEFIKSYLTDYSKQIFSHLNEPVQGDHKRFTFLRLATFLHDIGKPETRFIDNNGRTKFHNHQKVGAKKMKDICEDLRLSNKATNYLVKIVEKHMRIPNLLSVEEITDRATYRFIREARDELIDLILLCYVDLVADPGPLVERYSEEKMVKYFHRILKLKERVKKQDEKPLIRGDEIIEKFGLTPGPKIGEFLKLIGKEKTLGKISTKEQALKMIQEILK